jgi:putative two-component system response regulator
MTSKRSYRNVLPLDIVKAEIQKCSGSQFDPIIATAWLDILDNNYEEIENVQKEFPPSDENSVDK